GGDPGIDGLAESLVGAGYERVDRVEERGQMAVRGGLIDVFPTTGREPLRVEFFGDEIESIRAFSPFTQRALRQVESATVYPPASRGGGAVRTGRAMPRFSSARPGGGGPRASSLALSPRPSRTRPSSCGSRTTYGPSGATRAARSSPWTTRPSSIRSRRASRM